MGGGEEKEGGRRRKGGRRREGEVTNMSQHLSNIRRFGSVSFLSHFINIMTITSSTCTTSTTVYTKKSLSFYMFHLF